MLILTKAILAMLIGFILSIIMGLIAVPLLKKMKIKQKVSIFFSFLYFYHYYNKITFLLSQRKQKEEYQSITFYISY